MSFLVCHLKNNPSLVIADYSAAPGFDLSGLGQLTGCTVSETPFPGEKNSAVLCPSGYEGIPADAAEFTHGKTFSKEIDLQDHTLYYARKPLQRLEYKVDIWRSAVIHSCIAKILRGEKIALMHGALLGLPDSDEAIFLCGQSGMGKTTTSTRWQTAGQVCYSDDMMLLEYGEDTLYAHPFPTWSRCMNSLEGEARPAEKIIPLKTVLALDRDGEKEEIRPMEDYQFMLSVYASCTMFSLFVIKYLPEAERSLFIHRMQEMAKMLAGRFPRMGLFANLQYDIWQTFANGGLV